MSKRVVYSRGFPYGAPLVMVRGGATRDPEVKSYLKAQGFVWDGSSYAWQHYLDRSDLGPVLVHLRDELGCEVLAKEGMDPSYLLDLESPTFSRPLDTNSSS